jgi:hypothetical protein
MKNDSTQHDAGTAEFSTAAEGSPTQLLSRLLHNKHLSTPTNESIHGIAIGMIFGVDTDGNILVSRSLLEPPLTAQCLCIITPADIDRQCALMFENGNASHPIVIGLLHQPVLTLNSIAEQHDIQATEKIELQCGKASLTLSADGKIEMRGTKIVTHSTGLNHIRGASVKLN